MLIFELALYLHEIDKVSYSLGLSIASNLISTGIKTINQEAFNDAMNAVFAGQMPEIMPDEANNILQTYFERLQNEKGKEAKEAGEKFLTENKTHEGVVTLASGLQYKILKEGVGAKPTANDTVKCHYEGRLINGQIFDSSIKRGEPAEFPLNRVIAGWTKSLQEMTVGSKWELYIPADQAYGQRGSGPIGPNETLIFQVELLDIVTPQAPANE